jgi:dihydroorotate dehydrogenase
VQIWIEATEETEHTESFFSVSSVPFCSKISPKPIYEVTNLILSGSLARYDRSQTYLWNYEHAPQPPSGLNVAAVDGRWTFCGRPVPSPLGIAAGPLLNGRWVLYYAELGFDVLTYKTTRSMHRECYPLPNLQPVESATLARAGHTLRATRDMRGSWAISFGMPSMAPEVWRADVEWTRGRLANEKLLVVSVVATAQPGWSIDDVAADFAQCARWALDSGADCIETNFSCPNVATCDGQLFQQPAAAGRVAQCVREAIGAAPYLIKIGHVSDSAIAAELLDAVAPFADALAMTNCIAAQVAGPDEELMFDAQPRGIGGDSIRAASVEQVSLFSRLGRTKGHATRLIGVGGVSSAQHVREYLSAGAEAVQLATAVMVDPLVGLRIREELPCV